MLESLALAPASWLILGSLAVAAAVQRWAKAYVGFGRFAWLGILAYVASYFLSNAWRLGGSVEEAVLYWQIGLFLIAAMYAIIQATDFGRWHIGVSAVSIMVLVIILVFAINAPTYFVLAEKIFEFSLIVCIFIFALGCFIRLDRDQLLARMVWAVVVVAEGFAALEYLDCQLLHDPHRPRSETAACSEIYGNFAMVAAPLVTTAALCYIFWMWHRARRGHGR